MRSENGFKQCSSGDPQTSRRRRLETPDNTLMRLSKRVRQLQQSCLALQLEYTPTSASTLPPTNDCAKCGAIKFAFETANFCCCDGQVHLANNEFPAALIDLYGGNDANAFSFQKYARLYNNMFAFSSLGGSTDAKTKTGIFVFKLLGQLYHYISDLLPNNDGPKYLQLYFYDGEHERDRRAGLFPELKQEVISILMGVMEQNPYAEFFRSMREVDIEENTRVIISHHPSLDQRLYNAPTTTEVAAILYDNSYLLATNSPHIIVYGKSDEHHRVMHYYGCYDPLQYPLLYPQGDCGWHQGIKKVDDTCTNVYVAPTFPISSALIQDANDLITTEATATSRRPPKEGKEVSCREYYAYKFQIRPGCRN